MPFYPNKVRRYNPWGAEMKEASDGGWVRVQDYEKLLDLYEPLMQREALAILQSIELRQENSAKKAKIRQALKNIRPSK